MFKCGSAIFHGKISMNSERNNRKNRLFFILGILSFCLMNPGLAESTQLPPQSDSKILTNLTAMTNSHSQEMTRDGAEFLKEMAAAADALQSYSFQSHMNVFKGEKTIDENSKFFFKKPRKMRAEELGPFKKGSVAILLSNGKVK